MAKHSHGQKAGQIRKYIKSESTNTRLESIYEDALILSYHKYYSHCCATDTTCIVALHTLLTLLCIRQHLCTHPRLN